MSVPVLTGHHSKHDNTMMSPTMPTASYSVT